MAISVGNISGKQFNCYARSARTSPIISSIIERMKGQIGRDRKLRKRVAEIKDQLLMSQEQP